MPLAPRTSGIGAIVGMGCVVTACDRCCGDSEPMADGLRAKTRSTQASAYERIVKMAKRCGIGRSATRCSSGGSLSMVIARFIAHPIGGGGGGPGLLSPTRRSAFSRNVSFSTGTSCCLKLCSMSALRTSKYVTSPACCAISSRTHIRTAARSSVYPNGGCTP